MSKLPEESPDTSMNSNGRDAEIAAILASTRPSAPPVETPVPEESARSISDEETLRMILDPPPVSKPPEPESPKEKPVQETAQYKYMVIKSALREEQKTQQEPSEMQTLLENRGEMEVSDALTPEPEVPHRPDEKAAEEQETVLTAAEPAPEPATSVSHSVEMPAPRSITNHDLKLKKETIPSVTETIRANAAAAEPEEQKPVQESMPVSTAAQEPKEKKPSRKKNASESAAHPKHTDDSTKPKKKKQKSFGRRVRELFPEKGDDAFEIIRKLIFLASAMIFLVCIFLIGKYFWDNYKNHQMNSAIADIYDPDATEATESPEKDDVVPEDTKKKDDLFVLLPTVDSLLSINPDVVGFIRIPDTPIEYPVLQHRDAETANNYYLYTNIYLQPEKAGSIFMDYRNYFDYVLEGTSKRAKENSNNLIIYGHNMHDYSMFGSLKRYINEDGFYEEHPIIYLNSNYKKYQYKIFAMMIVDISDTTDTAFDYWNALDFKNETEFYDYVNEVKRRTVRLTDVDVQYGDQIVTLSTCNSTFSEGRLVIYGRLLRDGEDPLEGCTSRENTNVKWPNSYYTWRKKTYDPNGAFEPYG